MTTSRPDPEKFSRIARQLPSWETLRDSFGDLPEHVNVTQEGVEMLALIVENKRLKRIEDQLWTDPGPIRLGSAYAQGWDACRANALGLPVVDGVVVSERCHKCGKANHEGSCE